MNDVAMLAEVRAARDRLKAGLARAIIGQDDMVEAVLTTLFAGGHALLVGVPGVGKTRFVRALAAGLGVGFSRIQFTPDMLPGDITGSVVFRDSGDPAFEFAPGPVFANLVLADEVNRTPPKTQAALLEAMQEGSVTVAGQTRAIGRPFMVLATQNPIEQEGTYPLPEAQLDRFMMRVDVPQPNQAELRRILAESGSLLAGTLPEGEPVLTAEQVLAYQGLALRMPVADHALDYAVRLVQATQPGLSSSPAYVNDHVAWGAGPRAGLHLVQAAKSRAMLRGNPQATVEDIAAVAPYVLPHRVLLNFAGIAAGQASGALVAKLLKDVRP